MGLRYQVRGRLLMDMVRDIKDGLIEMSPFFQRKLVWRDIHKSDFIKTILLGYPFPEIFIARGDINVDTMTSVSAIVDGQQRMNSILEFTNNAFQVDGKVFADLSPTEKESFLKYEIAVIDLEIDRKDPQVVEIFKRLNRTFYSLSQIEKISTEYASSYMMLTAKALCGELISLNEDVESDLVINNVDPNLAQENPNISLDFSTWANSKEIQSYWAFIEKVFSSYELSRQVNLMYTLNLMSTLIYGIYNRNEQVIPQLEINKDDLVRKDEIVDKLEAQSKFILDLELSDEKFWLSKSNSFSLMCALFGNDITLINVTKFKNELEAFSVNPDPAYSLAAKEAVNNKKERLFRQKKIESIIQACLNFSTQE